jgi:hypothetical protein
MPIRPPGRAARLAAVRILAAGTLVVASLAAPPAAALPSNGIVCTVTSYYSTAKKITKVGLFATCPGSQGSSWGHKTAYYTTLTVQTGIRGDTKSPILTCEIIDGQFTCTANPITQPQ